MFYLGVISGIGATLLPFDMVGLDAFDPEAMRYYFSHSLIWIVPLLMVVLKLHTLDYKRIWKVPFIAYLVLCIILVNEVILTGAGFVHISHLYSNEVRNASLVWGPLAAVDFVGRLFTALTPELFLTVPIGENAGAVYYWPIVWLIIPSYILFNIIGFLLSLPFEFRRFRSDVVSLIKRIAPGKNGQPS
jgi:hypothetical protein